jgi:hypothetical protein
MSFKELNTDGLKTEYYVLHAESGVCIEAEWENIPYNSERAQMGLSISLSFITLGAEHRK